MINKAFIIPTGDEIENGTVLDLDSSIVLENLVKLNPKMAVTRLPPVLHSVAGMPLNVL